MKRWFVPLSIALVFGGVVWSNGRSLAFLFHDFLSTRQKVSFLEMKKGELHLYYVANGEVRKNKNVIADNFLRNLRESALQVGLPESRQIKLYVYNNWEEKGSHARDIRIAHSNAADFSLHCIINRKYNGLAERPEYQLLLHQKYGKPKYPALLTSTAAALSNVWNGKHLDDWQTFLLARELRPQFPAFIQKPSRFSEYLVQPWTAIFARFLREQYGAEAFAAFYRTATVPAGAFDKWMQHLSAIQPQKPAPYRFEPVFQKGVSYAYANSYHEGYATQNSFASLKLLQEIGVEWVASIPYGYMRRHDAVDIEYSGHGIIGESDEAMIALADDARKLGLRVMLKPQLWISHQAWPGKIHFQDEQSWNRWLQNYEHWITHYAILAELTGADLFCIGTELVQATLAHPGPWEKIIHKIRKIYHGPLVYAANHGREFEQLQFWPQLDYLGLDNYYSVRQSRQQNEAHMRSSFQKQKGKLREYVMRYRKPLLFTEIGYMANEGAGTGPGEYSYTKYNEQMQALAYRLALETYYDEPWFAGMYWWKWFSDPADRGKNADRHSPNGRSAETVLQNWYSRPVHRSVSVPQ